MIQIFDNGVFHLKTEKLSYAFYVRAGKLVHSYFGKAITVTKDTVGYSAISRGIDENITRECDSFEYGESGGGDFRIPAVLLRGEKDISSDFVYSGYEILKSKPDFGMPALRNGGETLKITLKDKELEAELNLYYTLFDGAIARRAEVVNKGRNALYVHKLVSACVDFPRNEYDIIDLNGRWGRECNISRTEACVGVKSFNSVRGVSSHQHNPFVAVADRTASEESGEVYGFSLIYSGNFEVECETDEKERLRVNIGEKIMTGGLKLAHGDSYTSPEVAVVCSENGIGGMSRQFHSLYRKNLINPKFADKPRPVVLNSWEFMDFNVSEQKLVEFIESAKGLGIDMIVLDDGWFGKRDDDTSSLGDWFIDKSKFPRGLQPVVDCCKKNGMKFGIWFEPEAINPVSELYKAHPEWALGVEGRERVQMRNQYVLDFSRPEVVDNIFRQMKKILDEYDVSYVKWDMNRGLSDVISAEKYHGYVMGVYDLYERLGAAYPDVLIEGCSSGGGRFDPAILYYSPMIWTSDDTDAYERAHIQYGASLCYPLQTLSNHVSVCPNHQTGRITPFKSRGAVASLGTFGYELDIGALTEEEREEVKRQVAAYKEDCGLILTGDLYRLSNPFETGIFCEQVVSEDKSSSYIVFMRGLNECNKPLALIKPRGLDEKATYKVIEKNITATGSDLMYGGIAPDAYGEDFGSDVLHIRRIS